LTPPRTIKEKHVKLKLGAALTPTSEDALPSVEAAVAAAAHAATLPPRCHPDAASIPQRSNGVADYERSSRSENWRRNVSFSAMAWRMAESVQQQQLLPGDTLDVAFTLDVNDHPEFGGLELILKDLRRTP